jgi:prepilin-type N-terminal cleavage/methylation domain-containing protein
LFAERRRRRAARGFSLIEIAAVMGILVMLATLAYNEFYASVMRARRVEAVQGLEAINTLQQEYFLRTGEFAGTFGDLGFAVEGGEPVGPTTYKGNRYTYELSQPYGPDTYYCVATAALDADPWPDVVEIWDM